MVASTVKGICHMAFYPSEEKALSQLNTMFPKADISSHKDAIQASALQIFDNDWNNISDIKLHLKGTPFQLKVWEALLRIPQGNLTTYGGIADVIAKPKASRAVGTAIGKNPIAFIIPCHRVIKNSGEIGGYMWGSTRKSAIIGWEAARLGA